MQANHGTLNVHRADCDRQHPNPCDPWPVRLPRVLQTLKLMGCSSYSWQECLPEQARDLTVGLGWATAKNPAAWSDENFNAVAIDRTKYTDLQAREVSLLTTVGDDGDQHRRSALWLQVQHLTSGARVWLSSSHYETGDPADRILQAKVDAATWPRDDRGHLADAIAGRDRNSYSLAAGDPRSILRAAGIDEVIFSNPVGQRSFHGYGPPVLISPGKVFDTASGLNRECVDGLHVSGAVRVRNARLVSTAAGLHSGTDHSGIVVGWAL